MISMNNDYEDDKSADKPCSKSEPRPTTIQETFFLLVVVAYSSVMYCEKKGNMPNLV